MGNTAVITGAGSGMGQSTVHEFVSQGWNVIAIDLADCSSHFDSPSVTCIQADVQDRAVLETGIANAVAGLGGKIDAVVNAAGIYPPTTLDNFTKEQFDKIFGVNVLGTLNVTAVCVPYMPEGSSVVNFASVDAFTVSMGQLLYGASKAAIVMVTKATALELAPKKIRVNGIAPGWVATPGNAATGRMEVAAKSIPLGRVAQPEEIAKWVWLMTGSGHSAFLDGETIVLSGADVLR